MSEQFSTEWEQRVRQTAVSFSYPPTPDVSQAVRQRLAASRPPRSTMVRRRAAWVVALVLLIVGGLLAVPPVRAAVWRIIRAGAISIFVNEPAPTAVPVRDTVVPPTPTLQPANEFIFDLAKSVTLAEAQAQARVPLKLPGCPDDLGVPDQVYLQDSNWPPTVILVWLEPEQPDEVRLSLYHIEADNYAYKGAENIEMTTVNDRDAIWLEAPHFFQLQNGQFEPWLFVEGSVLIWWTDGGVTYRLESGLSLAEARRIAESME